MRAAAVHGTWLFVALVSQAYAQTPPATAVVVSRNSGMCLDVPGASRNAGLQLFQWRCHLAANQQWDLRAVSGGYTLVNRNSGMCAGVAGSSLADGAAILQWPCNGNADQRFTLRASGDWVQLVASHSGKCLDVKDVSIDEGGAVHQWTCYAGKSQQWTLSAQGPASSWSARISLPIIPVAAATLRNGKILAWSAFDRFNYNVNDQGKTYSTLYDPTTNTATERLVSSTGHDMFCPGTATLPDGRILVNGGSSSAKTSIYDPAQDTWTTGAAMNVPRGYNSDTVLSTGEVLTVGGSWSGGLGNKIGEVWNKSSGWRKLPGIVAEKMLTADGAGIYRSDNHMWLFGSANGAVFHAGPSARMNWLTTSGNGTITSAGNRGDDVDSMNGNVVMFEAGKLFKVGGSPAYDQYPAVDSAYVIDFSRGPSTAVSTVKQKSMAFPRSLANSVVLPNGQVVVVGGQSYAAIFSDARAIMVPEIWTPATGAFQRLAPMAVPRTYHSVATLMLDGRVWVGGGGLCGNCPVNHPDAEILSPPYLFNADGTAAARPAIRSAPTSVSLDQTITVQTDRAVSSFALVRLSAVTHSTNNDQRRLPLSITGASGTSYQVRLPADRGTLLQGEWMLFAMTSNGTPSIASVIRVQ